jgi:hypothetical protein
MTSERKIKANRANARASTGPKTARGRAHAARSALRHGLSLSIYSIPTLSEEVEALAREIVGSDVDIERKELARRIAEAQIDLRRVRHIRHRLFSEALSDPDYQSAAIQRKKLAAIVRCLRASGPAAPVPDDVTEFVNSKPEGPHKFALEKPMTARQGQFAVQSLFRCLVIASVYLVPFIPAPLTS